ncbi:MAG: SDR family oxidoreductase [Casimicrobiaceae bacterium]
MNVFITGASSGVGAALARHYAAQGATLGLVARRGDALASLAAELAPAQCAIYVVDVRDVLAIRNAAENFTVRFGVPDIVIGNAGISRGTLTRYAGDNAVFREVMETNVLGLLHTFQPFVEAMRAAGRGRLVGIASVAGLRGLPGAAAYSASKAAVISYLESLRVEMRGSGVDVVTLCPGYISTPMTANNPYRMPFLLPPDRAAQLIAHAIDKRRRFCVLPWQMALLSRVFRCLPRPIYDAVFARAKHKPRAAAAD